MARQRNDALDAARKGWHAVYSIEDALFDVQIARTGDQGRAPDWLAAKIWVTAAVCRAP